MKLTFEWDESKARSNLKNHKVSFELAASVFGDPNSVTVYDDSHSQKEERFVTIGMSDAGPLVVVCHTDRGDRIRIISARKATANEKKQYEERI